MRRQRNMFQMKQQNKTLEKELNKVKIRNLTDKQLKIMIINMLTKLAEEWMMNTVRISKKS